MGNDKKKRPVVGIMTGSFHSDYPRTIFFEMYERLRHDDIDIRLYNGLDGNIYFNRHKTKDDGFDTHWLNLYEYSFFDDLDLLIVAYGNIMASHPHIEPDEFLKNLPDVPVIIIGSEIEPKGGAYVMIDNYAGMKANVAHLIDLHGYRDIAFISGPKENQSASLRMEAYLDALSEHDIPIRDELIVYGDYSNNVDAIVEELFERNEHMDAIVSSNDEMCNAIYRVAALHGLKVGKDIAVTGFDDADFAKHLDPPLSTIKQDYRLLVYETVGMIRSFLAGSPLTSRKIPATTVPRESCGCGESSYIYIDDETKNTQYISYDKVYQMQQQTMSTMVMLRNLLIEVHDRRTFFEKLAQEMTLIGAKSSYIYMLDEPMLVSDETPFKRPEKLKLFMRQEGVHLEAYDENDAPVVQKGELSKTQVYNADEPTMMVTFLLFYGRYQYGILRVEAAPEDILFFYSLSIQIANGIRHLMLVLKEAKNNKLLREKNQILDFAAYHDRLTGLYNRAGVMQEIVELLNTDDSNKHYVAVMGDLDHLKQINDTLGHNAGDIAIKAAADVLKEALPDGCSLGRSGGDEFTGIFLYENDRQIDDIRNKINELCLRFDDNAGQDFYLGVSVGFYEFIYNADDIDNINEIYKKADRELYSAKKKRRDNVIRK